MGLFRKIRTNLRSRVEGTRPGGKFLAMANCLAVLASVCGGAVSLHGQAAPTYQITAASPATIPAGAAGATIGLTGTLPDFTQNTYQVCFYTGAGSGAPLTPTATGGVQTISVPAATIQSIPATNFTATNGYVFRARVYVVPSGQTCDGNFDATLTNSLIFPIIEPTLAAYNGPSFISQPNPVTGAQAAPASITLSGANFVANTTVLFGSYGQVTPRTLTPNALTFALPSAFLNAAASTQVTISVCNGGGLATAFCSAPVVPITFTLSALANSSGTITATPSPALTSQPVTLTSTFKQSSYSTNPVGSPSGMVTFTADGQTLEPARLILDKTAGFTPLTTALTVPTVATPVIAPAAGTYINTATVTLTDTTAGASIYYTQDGSTPTTDSTLYAAPFSITTSQTLKAIGALAGSLNSAVASSAYTITISPPTQVVFQTQPVTTAINTAITPAVQVAVEDVNGNVVTSYSGPVTVSLIENPVQGMLGGTLTQNAVAGIATFANLTVNNVFNGYAMQAVSGRLTPAVSSTFNITPYPITFTLPSQLVGIGATLTGTFTLGHPAPAGGITVQLASSATANVTVSPASVMVAAGDTVGSFTYAGVAAGSSNLTATATNYLTATTTVTGTAAQVSLGTIPPVAPGQAVSLALSLAMPAPAGGTTVTFTSSRPGIATITQSVFVPAGQQTATANPQVTGILIGTTTITANAPGYAPAMRAVNVTVVATISPSTTNIYLATSTTTVLTISAPAPTGGITFTMTSDDPTIATVPATVTVIKGATSVQLPVTGLKDGRTTIRANSAGVTEATGAVLVASQIPAASVITGYHLQNYLYQYLPISPQSPVTVTYTSNDTSVVTLATTNTAVGTKTITFPNTTSQGIGYVYFQGQKIGTATLTVSAPGYTDGTVTVTVDPSGFVFYGTPNFNTTTFSSPTTNTVYLSILNNDLSVGYYGYGLNPGLAPISIPVTSSNTTVGTIVDSPLVFHSGETSHQINFKPASVGTSTITIGAPPAGFSVPSQYQSIVATVSSPVIASNNYTTGVHLMTSATLYLPVGPPNAEAVTVTSSAPGVVTLSSGPRQSGTASLTYNVASGSSTIGSLYVQGQSVGTSTLTISAPGYTTGTSTITVMPSGFVFYGDRSGTTTTFSSPTTNYVYPTILNADLSAGNIGIQLNPDYGPVSVPVTSSRTTVGTVAPAPVVFQPGESSEALTFTPVGAGSTVVAIGAAPTGFSKPTSYQQFTATVTAPAITVNGARTGAHLTTALGIGLPVAPPSATTVTVSVPASAAGTVLLSTDPTAVGSTSLTFPNVTGTSVGTIYVQGQSAGSVTLTESAPGYTTGTSTITVYPSGFGFYYDRTYTTSTFSAATAQTLYTVLFDPSTMQPVDFGYALNPGFGPVTVGLTDSAPTVATLDSAAVVFKSGDGYHNISVTPVSAGVAKIALAATPAGFGTPAVGQMYTVTVTAPAIGLNDTTTGLHLERALSIGLPVAPPNPVTVTVISNGPAIAAIAGDATTIGTNTVVFTNVTSTYVGQIFVQGEKIGTTTITEMAPGYTNGDARITVLPSGFNYYGNPAFTTQATSAPNGVTVYASPLNTGTLTVYDYGYGINPDFGPVSVPVTSSNTSVGTVTSPVVFGIGVGSATYNFQPVAAGTSTLTLGTPTGFSTPSQYTTATATVQ